MELYDLIFLGILGLSCFAGIMHGGIKELFNLASFFVAFLLAVFSRPFMMETFKLDQMTGIVAAIVLFFVFYILIRFLGTTLSDSIRKKKVLNLVDRLLGLGVGVVRTLIAIGVIHIVLSVIWPVQKQEPWMKEAKVYPLAASAAKILQSFIPKGSDAASSAEQTGEQSGENTSSLIAKTN
jgi:membrane protein required for colicin V production